MAPLSLAEGAWMGRLRREQQEAWRMQIFEVQILTQVRGLARVVMCKLRSLGNQWPQEHILLFEGLVALDTRVVCPKTVKNLLKEARMVFWKTWAAKHVCEELLE